jgi:hypothetical protein
VLSAEMIPLRFLACSLAVLGHMAAASAISILFTPAGASMPHS